MKKKRRGKGEGSIYRTSDGRWRAAVSLGWRMNAEGKPVQHRKVFSGRTRAEVQEKLTKALRDQQQGLPVAGEKQTLGQFLENWLEQCAKPAVRPLTYTSYAGLVRNHLIPELGRYPLAKLSPQQVQAFLNKELQVGLSPRSVQYLHAVLRRSLNQALEWGLVARNVTKLVRPPRQVKHEIRPFSPAEAQQFLRAAEGDRLEALYGVGLAIGLREGEAFALHWPDVDLDAGVVRVKYTLYRANGKLVFAEPKSPKSRRTIRLPAVAIAALRRHQARQEQERLWAGSRWREHGLVFCTTIGTALDGGNVRKKFKSLLRQAGLPASRFHDLRHSCATLLLAQGVHPKVVQEILGHSGIAITMDTYSHILPSMEAGAAAEMDRILAPLATGLATKSDSEEPNGGTTH